MLIDKPDSNRKSQKVHLDLTGAVNPQIFSVQSISKCYGCVLIPIKIILYEYKLIIDLSYRLQA